MACGCNQKSGTVPPGTQTVETRFPVQSFCSEPMTTCSQEGARLKWESNECEPQVGLNAGCTALVPGCTYTFQMPSALPNGETRAHFIWVSQPGDAITVTFGPVVGVENVSPAGGVVQAGQVITATTGPVEFDLVIQGPVFKIVYASQANANELEVCQILFQTV